MGESGLQGVHMGGIWTEGETCSGTGDKVRTTTRGRQGTGVPRIGEQRRINRWVLGKMEPFILEGKARRCGSSGELSDGEGRVG